MHCYTFLQLFLMSGLIKDCWTLTSASAFNLFWYTVFVEVYDKNLSSRECTVGQGRNILIASSGNCGSYPLILYQNLTNGVSCNVESDPS